MAMLGGEKYSRDLAAAKRIFSGWVLAYSSIIVPDISVRVRFEYIHPSYDAWAEMFDDGVAEMTVNTLFLEANMYNLESKEVQMIPVHELCHLKVFIEDFAAWKNRTDPDDKEVLHDHRDTRFVSCVKKFFHARHARPGPHPGRLSFGHYFGSKDGVVPVDIFYIYSYYCPKCNATWDENSLMIHGKLRTPDVCSECGGPVENVKHLTPREVLRYDIPDDIIVYR
jgi:hypothetical protein